MVEFESVCCLIAKVAEKCPDAIAIIDNKVKLTYRELNEQSSLLASFLKTKGVDSGSSVCVLVERSANFIIAILAVLKAGGYYVPIDSGNPDERVKHIIKDSGAELIITGSKNAIKSFAFSSKAVFIDGDEWKSSGKIECVEYDPESVAYMVYTSGSSGVPKGVEIMQKSLSNLVSWHIRAFGHNSHYRFAQTASIGFDAAVWEIWTALCSGATIYIVPGNILMEPDELIKFFKTNKIDEAFVTTAVTEILIKKNWPEGINLKRLYFGGEKITVKPNENFPAELVNLYGPTECTVISIYGIVPLTEEFNISIIGREVDNCQIYVLDENLNILSDGEMGEIFIGGICVGKGYHNQPDLTAKAFVKNPFDEGILYRTGDLGRKLPDGTYEYIGRRDSQVKIRGFRMELSEIEAVLQKHDDIEKSVVICRDGKAGGKYLACYISLKKENKDIINDLKNFASKYLPAYMVPSAYCIMDEIPLTVNGKIDKNKLPEPGVISNDDSKPISETEIKLSKIWTKVLKHEVTSIDLNFFMLGGHSLLASVVCNEIETAFLVKFGINFVFSNPTIRLMAERIEKTLKINISSLFKINILSRNENIFRASFSQEKFWKMEETSPEGHFFNIPISIDFKGEVDPILLEKAFNIILARNESLRTGFEIIENELYQKIHPFEHYEMACEDFSNLTEIEAKEKYSEFLDKSREKSFKLNSYPLFTFHFYKFSSCLSKVIFNIHHSVFDGWSAALFFKELRTVYKGLMKGLKDISEKPLYPQYVDYSATQRKYLNSGAQEQQLEYWKQKLNDFYALPRLPFEKNGIEKRGKTLSGSRHYFTVPEDLAVSLKDFSLHEGVTLFMTLKAVLHTLIFKYTSSLDIATGTVLACRHLPGTQRIFGPLTNDFVLRSIINPKESFRELLNGVKESVIELTENQNIPYSLVVKNSTRNSKFKKDLFNISLILQNLPWPEMKIGDISMSYNEHGSKAPKTDISIVLEERNGEYIGWFEYKDELFEHSSVASMAQDYLTLCRELISQPKLALNSDDLNLQTVYRKQSCFICGTTSIAIEVAKKLQNSGFYIYGIFSNDESVMEWAANQDIPCYDVKSDVMYEIMSSVKFGYLFSIINSYILPGKMIDLAHEEAINYHDSPLPRYAGLHATAWAIMNGETSHAISFHRITEGIDEGDILKQKHFQIDEAETSATINLKAMENALAAFDELLEDILSDSLKPQKQDFSLRTYYGMNDRPYAASIIDWSAEGKKISAMVRGLNFGRHENEIAMPKIISNGSCYFVIDADISAIKSTAKAGEIVKAGKDFLVVATADSCIEVKELSDINGERVDCRVFNVGDSLLVDQNVLKNIDVEFTKISKYENYWLKKLSNIIQPELPTGFYDEKNNNAVRELVSRTTVRSSVVFSLFAARLCGVSRFSLMMKPVDNNSEYSYLKSLVAEEVPFPVSVDFDKSVEYNIGRLDKLFNKACFSGSYSKDLFLRYKALREVPTSDFLFSTDGDHVEIQFRNGADAEKILERFEVFDSNLVGNFDKPLSEISLLEASEFKKQIFDWNNNARDYDLLTPYIKQFERNSEDWPQKTAVSYKGNCLSYSKLRDMSCKIGCYLKEEVGVLDNETIGLYAKRSDLLIPAMLGIFKATCAYLPLEPGRYPIERIDQLLTDASVSTVIVCVESDNYSLPEGVNVINLSEKIDDIMNTEFSLDEFDYKVDDTAYVIYTSGSTGAPKGVMVSQKNMLNHNLGVIDDYELTEADNVLQFGALGFDLSVEEIFPTLLAGAKLVLLEPGLMENPGQLVKFIDDEKISFIDFPTAYFHEFVGHAENYKIPKSLRLVVIGGEKVSEEHIKRWREIAPNVRLINTYGPTEATIIASWGEDKDTIGRPCANTRTYILDKIKQPLPTGMTGELYIAGTCVAKGYINRPLKNAEVFLKDPFFREARMYKTGDLAKFREDGEIIYQGRADTQVKFRGFRIELGEIESAINKHPSVRNSVVFIIDRKDGTPKRLAAYIIPSRAGFDMKSVKTFIAECLPEYMIPQIMKSVEEIPLNANGKVDRKKLVASVEDDTEEENAVVTQEVDSPLEIQISLIFQKLLNIKGFDLNASFFELGGDSLTAIRLSLELEKETGVKVPVEKLYKAPSVRKFAKVISESDQFKDSKFSSLVHLSAGEKGEPLYFIHTTPGDILGYVNLVRQMSDRPIWGLQAIGLDLKQSPHTSIVEMATYYKKLIYKNNPEGPYHLSGWCFGGVVAYEIARQMKSEGKEVGVLALIETWGNRRKSIAGTLSKIKDLILWGPAGWKSYINSKLMASFSARKHIQQLDFIAERFDDNSSVIDRLKDMYRINFRAADNYFMEFYDGEATLIRVKKMAINGAVYSKDYRMKHHVRKLNIAVVDGTHDAIIKEPHVQEVAQILSRLLDNTVCN